MLGAELWLPRECSRRVTRQNRRICVPAPASGPPVITDPTQIPGCFCWYRSDLGITLNGGNVSAWADQTGNGLNLLQSNATNQPPYVSSGGANNRPYLSFSASAPVQYLLKTMAKGPPLEVFHVLRPTTPTNPGYFSAWGNNFYAIVNETTAPGPYSIYMASPTDTPALGPHSSAITDNTDHIFDCLFNTTGNNATMFVDGVDQGGATAMVQHTTTRLTVGSLTSGTIALGGWTYELAAWTRALTATEKTQLSRYGGTLYGITVP